MTVATGSEPHFSWAAVASLVAAVRGARVSWAHLRCVWLLATCFQRAESGLAATSHLKEGNLFFFALRDLGSLLDKAVSKGCKQTEQPLPKGHRPRAGRSAGLGPRLPAVATLILNQVLVATFQGQPPGAASPFLNLGDTQRSGWIWLRNAQDATRGRIVEREGCDPKTHPPASP